MRLTKLIKTMLTAAAVATTFSTMAQELTIELCRQQARANYPLIKRYDLIRQAEAYNLSNAGKAYLPQVSLQGRASYQTQVTELPIKLPGIDIRTPGKDQYGIALEVSQTVWDGGAVSAQRSRIRTAAAVERGQLEVDLHELDGRIDQLYFGILLLQARLEQHALMQKELERNSTVMAAIVENGVARPSELDAVRVKQLEAEQLRIQLESDCHAYIEMMQRLTGITIGDSVVWSKPDIAEPTARYRNNRPEMELFALKAADIDARRQTITAGLMPKIGLFATGGYANPALNLLKEGFSTYFIGGVRFSWNLGLFYTQRRERQLIETGKLQLQTMRETFELTTDLEASRLAAETEKQRRLLAYDDEKIALQNRVKQATEAAVTNGTATATDWMRDVTAEELARQEKIRHEIEALFAACQWQQTVGKEKP